MNDVLARLQHLQEKMTQAAESEDYVEASSVKTKRDDAHGVVVDKLSTIEAHIETLVLSQEYSSQSFSPNSINEFKSVQNHLEDLSLSTIRRFDEDDASAAIAMTGRSFQIDLDDRRIISRHNSQEPKETNLFQHKETMKDKNSTESNNLNGIGDEHPLEGIANYEILPFPEDIYNKNEGGSLNSSNSLVSTDSVSRIEYIMGEYRTKCFFSKHWSLREAAVLKLSLILPSIVNRVKAIHENNDDWWYTFTRSLCIILEKAINDKIIQVSLSSLLLLDDFMDEIENMNLSQKEGISLLQNIVINLVDKISSSNQKLVEGVETILISLALHPSVGPSYIGTQVMKQMTTRDSKGKLLCARYRLLRNIVAEFGNDAPNGQKIMDFVSAFGTKHKDPDVRDTAKELVVAVYLRDGNIVLSMLGDLSERQMKEYKLSFASAKKASTNGGTNEPRNHENVKKNENNITKISKLLSPPAFDREGRTVPNSIRGRGRGRGRTPSQQIDSIIGV